MAIAWNCTQTSYRFTNHTKYIEVSLTREIMQYIEGRRVNGLTIWTLSIQYIEVYNDIHKSTVSENRSQNLSKKANCG